MAMGSRKKQSKAQKKRKNRARSLEEIYRQYFAIPTHASPLRDRLTMFQTVPSVTTYGVYEKPI